MPRNAGICADGPMAGREFAVSLDATGSPAEVVDVDGCTYLLAVQQRPVQGRPWRYAVVSEGALLVLEGGQN